MIHEATLRLGSGGSEHFSPRTLTADRTAMAPQASEGMTSGFRVQLFGSPRVLRAESAVRLSPLQLALVVVVYGHGREGIGRLRAAELLWGAGAEADVRHRIRQLLLEV